MCSFVEELSSIILYELAAENTMYLNSINILLIRIVRQRDMTEFSKPQGVCIGRRMTLMERFAVDQEKATDYTWKLSLSLE